MQGRLIILEGPDASGTTLHAHLLAEYLQAKGADVVVTAEPTDGPIGRFIRSVLKGEQSLPSSALQLLFTADRAWHLEHVIHPALKEGKTVISDRYAASTVAYGMALGLDRQWLEDMNRPFPKPDILIFTLPPLDICLERLSRRSERDIMEKKELQGKIHASYRSLAEADPSIIVIDTSGDKQAVAGEIAQAL